MISKLVLFTLPILVFIANIISVSASPQGFIAILVIFLILITTLDNKEPKLIQVNLAGKSILVALLLYTSTSSIVVAMVDDTSNFKSLALITISLIALCWFILSSSFSQSDIDKNFHAFCKGVLVISALYLLMITPLLSGGFSSRSWAEISNRVLPKRNDVSLFFLAGLCGYLFLNFGLKKNHKLIACSIITTAVLLSFSRTAYLALSAILFYYLIVGKNKSIAIISVSLLSTFVLYSENNPILDRIQYTFGEGGYDDSTSSRLYIWTLAIDLAEKHPIFGAGSGRSPFWGYSGYEFKSESLQFAHNYFITQLYQLGIVGLAMTLGVFTAFYLMAKNIPKEESNFSISVLILFVVMSFSGEPLYGYGKYIFLILYSSLINKRSDQTAPSPINTKRHDLKIKNIPS